MSDRSNEYALLAVQGPQAFERLGLDQGKAFTWEMGEIDGVEVMVNRTGYTGEEGCELLTMAEDAGELWDRVLARGVVPCGLGARDTLRLEVCYPLHGNDIDGRRPTRSRPGSAGPARSTRSSRRADVLREIKASAARAQARRVRDGGEGDPAAGHADRRAARRGDVGVALADARRRHRYGLRPRRPSRPTPS